MRNWTIGYQEVVRKSAFVKAETKEEAEEAFLAGDFDHGQTWEVEGTIDIDMIRDDGPVKEKKE